MKILKKTLKVNIYLSIANVALIAKRTFMGFLAGVERRDTALVVHEMDLRGSGDAQIFRPQRRFTVVRHSVLETTGGATVCFWNR